MSQALPPFNSPFVCQQLHVLPQYAVSPSFMNYIQWHGTGSNVLALAGSPTDTIEPAYAIVVGVVVSNRPYLGVQGNFSPTFVDPLKTVKAAKLQFEIVKPVLDPDFGLDYDVDYDNFLDLQDKITKTSLRWFFLIEDRKTMKFNYPLWESKTDDNNTPECNTITAGYNVNANCTPRFDLIKQSHQLCHLPLYNANKNLDTKPKTWESKLIGTMVEVTFSLKHYHMVANSQHIEASNIFSAKVESPDFTLANGDILASATVPVSSSADSVGSIMLTLTGPSSGAGKEPMAGGNGLERAPSAGTQTRCYGQDEEDHADVDVTGASPVKKSRW